MAYIKLRILNSSYTVVIQFEAVAFLAVDVEFIVAVISTIAVVTVFLLVVLQYLLLQ